MSYQEQLDWSAWLSANFPNTTELNPPSATTRYNCHAYAWYMTEGGSPCWINYEDEFWEGGIYIRLNSESDATKISYYQDDHSAIQMSTQGVYRSKWGVGPLVEHARDYGPAIYQMDYGYYYAAPVISGPSQIYSSGGTFSVKDFYNVTYTGSTSSNLLINGSTSSRTVNVLPTSESANE